MLDKEIIYLKSSPKIWHEIEDESLCIGEQLDDSLSSRTKSSNSKNSSGKSSANENGVIIENVLSESSIPSLATSRMLDWFMSCCWKCSPGCQQLPTLNM
ncbi:atp-dependent rna helicase [Holotrichia oblita]|uniref:Atp-dependent rna helicase n=1 Tax=Holotrichia oblita TaxID=644536 RepID=A0ACB9TUG7_HOLOL|nr:atp-dependent rna helicase [Holotrichia oblita]